ncbi:MAG: DUF362 domain-containing protein [Vicinamibacterales bacterium]
MNRREFLERAAVIGATCSPFPARRVFAAIDARVAVVSNTTRAEGVHRAVTLLGLEPLAGRDGFIKPNFNSADVTPGSTHNDTLSAVATELRRMGAGSLTIGDRSGMGNTRDVMQSKDVFALARDLKARTIVFDELPDTEWEPVRRPGLHWSRGFAFPRPVLRAGFIVSTCCLKTHRYGGHFTLSLKNSVGFAAKQVPGDSHNYMTELHRSASQRRMIAEINTAYRPALVVLDAVQGFTTEGPDKGTLVEPGVVIAGTDRVAVDAVGVALLRLFGTTPEVSRGAVFDQEQIARAVELGLGVTSPDAIRLVTDDARSEAMARRIETALRARPA